MPYKVVTTNIIPPAPEGPLYTMGNQYAADTKVLKGHEGCVVSVVLGKEPLKIETSWPGLDGLHVTEPREGETSERHARRHIGELRDLAKKSPILVE